MGRLGVNGAFVAVTTLFFAWGFIASNNDPLIAAMRTAFDLTYSQALQIQLVSFLANGLISLPAAACANRLGAVNTILLALATMLSGCLSVGLALSAASFPGVLLALFVLALGMTTLQVAANPLAAVLGPDGSSHVRLNLAQTVNALGVVIGANYGAAIMLGNPLATGGASGAPRPRELLDAVNGAYLAMAALVAMLAMFVWSQRRRIGTAVVHAGPPAGSTVRAALRSGWALFGALAIALYVGAEVSIAAIMINFLNQASIMGLSLEEGGFHLANVYWGGALAGRFVGTALLTRIAAPRLLALCAGGAVFLCLIAFAGVGAASGWAALGVGLFNSIMFPTIFSLTLERAGPARNATSGLLVLAISLGAVLPFGAARIADAAGLSAAFAVPAAAYLVIVLFALRAARRA